MLVFRFLTPELHQTTGRDLVAGFARFCQCRMQQRLGLKPAVVGGDVVRDDRHRANKVHFLNGLARSESVVTALVLA